MRRICTRNTCCFEGGHCLDQVGLISREDVVTVLALPDHELCEVRRPTVDGTPWLTSPPR
ncbi:hypothetical protein FKO01_26385 [Mesorhizobium sp. B2-3-3]|nr:hypothetical protein FKO01_26385 [Mesorhizobium sp. B2-3-3]